MSILKLLGQQSFDIATTMTLASAFDTAWLTLQKAGGEIVTDQTGGCNARSACATPCRACRGRGKKFSGARRWRARAICRRGSGIGGARYRSRLPPVALARGLVANPAGTHLRIQRIYRRRRRPCAPLIAREKWRRVSPQRPAKAVWPPGIHRGLHTAPS